MKKLIDKLIHFLGGHTKEDLNTFTMASYFHGEQRGRAEGKVIGRGEAKHRAIGLVDGFRTSDDFGRSVDLARMIRERV